MRFCRALPGKHRAWSLCTLHMQRPDNVENVIVNALFGMGRPLPGFSLAGDPKRGSAEPIGTSACTIAEHSLER